MEDRIIMLLRQCSPRELEAVYYMLLSLTEEDPEV